MKKILILNWRDPKHPNAGGAEQATMIHAQAWKKAGYDITWFSSHVDGLAQTETYKGIKIIRRGYLVFLVQWEAFKHLQNNTYDLVVDQIHGLPFFTPLYLKSTPVLAYIHELSKEVVWHNPYPFPLNTIVGALARLLEPIIFFLIYKNTQFMTVSNSTKKELESLGINKISVIENGVTIPETIAKYRKETDTTLIYLGALAKDKGVEDVIDIFNRLSLAHKNWNFWIVGKGEEKYRRYLSQEATKGIKFFGYVSESRKFELLGKAHILINPSIREGWGLVNIEANSVGTPVIGYKVTGMVDSVIDTRTGILVKKHDTKSIIKAINVLVNNKDRYNTMVIDCRKHAKKFTWKNSINCSTILIKEVINGSKK